MGGLVARAAYHAPSVPAKVNAPAPAMSAGTFPARRADLDGFRRRFPHMWSDFLHRHFRNSVEVAVFFSCDDRTARAWLDGVNAPRAEVALYAVASIGGALAELTGAA